MSIVQLGNGIRIPRGDAIEELTVGARLRQTSGASATHTAAVILSEDNGPLKDMYAGRRWISQQPAKIHPAGSAVEAGEFTVQQGRHMM